MLHLRACNPACAFPRQFAREPKSELTCIACDCLQSGNPEARAACEPLLPEIENLKIYVGNLPYSVTSEDLSDMFKEYGDVEEATLIMDRETGRSKGFAFVEMQSNSDADRAIKGLNGTQLDGRALTVNQARPRESRPRQDRSSRRW